MKRLLSLFAALGGILFPIPLYASTQAASLNLQTTYNQNTLIEIRVTNTSSAPITFNETGQCHRFFKVYSQTQEELLITDPNTLCTLEFRSVTVAPQETRILDTWNQKIHIPCPPNANCIVPPILPVAPGPYTIEVLAENLTPIRKTITIVPSTPFSDVPQSHWAYSYINSLYNQDVIHGYGDGKFGPENSITRAEVVKIAIKAATVRNILPVDTSARHVTRYQDVPDSHNLAPYINQALQLGIIAPATNFHPNRPATRFECLEILLKAFQKQNEIEQYEPSGSTSFNDNTSPQMNTYTSFARDREIVSGIDDKFYPNVQIRRSEIAKIAINLINS